LIKARPKGPTCHEGTVSCFGDEGADGVGFLSYLETLIEGRGVETALAAVAETEDKLVSEAADLFYHTLVLLAAKDMKLEAVIAELKGRH